MRKAGADLFVGLKEGRIVATYQLFIINSVSLNARRRAMVEDVRVDPAERGQGIGALLMADAERRAKNAGCTLCQLLSNRERDAAHRFYNRLGYEPTHFGFKKRL